MTKDPIELDIHRGMAAQKATEDDISGRFG